METKRYYKQTEIAKEGTTRRKILDCLLEGLSDQQVSEKLHISRSHVRVERRYLRKNGILGGIKQSEIREDE